MTRHALPVQCPPSEGFPVSSLGEEGARLQPRNLAEPLTWLAGALQAQDEARMEKLWSLAAGQLQLLQHCVDCFARRYPAAPLTPSYRHRLREAPRRPFRR